MKKLALLLSFAFVAGVAGAQETKPANPNPEKAAAMAADKTHEVKAEVVAFDAMKSTLTIKGDKENKTVPVEGKALAALKDVKPGAKLTLVCKDDAAGMHQAVVDVKPSADKK
jgi:ABC-type Fe3+-hydroxamate transport system substrate-binding protein